MMGSFQRSRPRFMSSPVLSDLTRFHAGPNTLHACNSTIWNSLTGSGCRVASCHTHSQRPISSDQSLQGRSSAVQRALHVEREHQVAAKERDGLLRHRLLAESSADGRPDGDSGAHLRLRWRAAGGAGRGLVALLHRNAAYPSGHLLPAAGSGAVRPPDGAVGLPRFGAAEAPPGGRSANCGRRATRRHAHAAGAAGGARVRCGVQFALPSSGAPGGHGGVAVPQRCRHRRAPPLRVAQRRSALVARRRLPARHVLVSGAPGGARGRGLPGEGGRHAAPHGGQRTFRRAPAHRRDAARG
ncbi:uncharacterized protein LOC144054063 isoform X3 [Vanacampus margaritifer]